MSLIDGFENLSQSLCSLAMKQHPIVLDQMTEEPFTKVNHTDPTRQSFIFEKMHRVLLTIHKKVQAASYMQPIFPSARDKEIKDSVK